MLFSRTGAAVLALTLCAGLAHFVAQPAGAEVAECTISGTAFLDEDRDEVRDPTETPRAGDVIYLFDAAGSYVTGATTNASGSYTFPAVTCGTYKVEYAAGSWWPIRESVAPTTTGSVWPRQTVTGTATASFGWRQIGRSTTAGAPLSAFTGPSGVLVESYNDVVSARELHDALVRGTVGAEAGHVTIRFDLGGTSTTSSAIGATSGVYDRFSAICSVSYLSWLDGADTTLVHEYGHAWSLYRAYLIQQDPSMTGYLKARGLELDPRVGSSYAWAVNELVAEDYRQLLGAPTAASAEQTNRDLPPAASVAGLREYLLGAFSGIAAAATVPSASASPVTTPPASPSPVPATSPSTSPSPTASPSAPRPQKARGGCRKSC